MLVVAVGVGQLSFFNSKERASDRKADDLSAALTSEKFVVLISEEIAYSSQVLASLHYAFQIYHHACIGLPTVYSRDMTETDHFYP